MRTEETKVEYRGYEIEKSPVGNDYMLSDSETFYGVYPSVEVAKRAVDDRYVVWGDE